MKILFKHWGLVFFILSILPISIALIAEYYYNLIPCKLCLNQRYPYYFIIILFSFFYLIRETNNIWLYLISKIAILYGLFYSIWHVGVENKVLKEPSSCSETLSDALSIESLKNQIINKPIVNCSEVSWSIFGFSAATINTILLIIILIINTIFVIKLFNEKNKEKKS